MLSPEYVSAVEQSVLRESKFPADFSGETVVEYMRDRRRAMRLIDICLDPVVSARAEYNPLKDLLFADETDPEIQAESAAYIYAFRKLMGLPPDTLDRSTVNWSEPHSPEWNKTALIKLIEDVPFRPGFLVKVLLNDVPSIMRTFPRERTPEAYAVIANSNYVAALSTLYTMGNGEISHFLEYQLLFPLSPASVIAHYYPIIGQEEDSIPIGYVGNTALYSREILWLSKQLLEHGSYKDMPYGDVLMLELGGLLEICRRFTPEEVKPAQDQLVALARSKGLDQKGVDQAFDEFSEGVPPDVEGARDMLSFLPPNLGILTQAEARTVLDRIISLRPTRTQKSMIANVGKMIDSSYQLGDIKEEEGEDF